MTFLSALWSGFLSLNRLAFCAVVTNATDASFNITNLIVLGHLGKGHLASGVIALAFYNIAWYFIEGVLTAQDNLVARSFALNDEAAARYWSLISFAVAMLLCIPGTVLFIFSAIIVQSAFMIGQHTAGKAARFILLLIPALWCHATYRVLQKYLL